MSPTIYRFQKYRFFFFSREEPRKHIHVTCPDGEAKFWLEPEISLANNSGLSEKEITLLEKTVREKYKDFIDEWNTHFRT